MLDMLISLLAGLSAPAVAYLVKSLLEHREKNSSRLIDVVDKKGKKFSILVEGKLDERVIGKILENEYNFENKLEKIFINYKKNNKFFNYYRNTHVDFIIELKNKTIAIEAKSSGSLVSKDSLNQVKKNHPEVNEMFLVFDSEVPKKYLNEFSDDGFVKFISSPRGKALNEKIVNVLNHEANQSQISKASR